MSRGARIWLVAVMLAMASGLRANTEPGARRIVVSIPPQKFIAERIAGDLVNVQIMLEPGHAPETFEPTPRHMARVAGADFYFSIGVPFEDAWLPELQQQSPELHIIKCCEQFTGPVDWSAGHRDPHVWVSPARLLRAAELMRAALQRTDPGNDRIFDHGYRTLSAELLMLQHDLRDLLKNRRIDEFIISHGALGPLAEDLGLTQIALEAGGREVGPRSLADITAMARRLEIRTVFVLKQHNQGPARALARELDAELVEIDPLAGNYLDNMRAIGRLLAAATR